MLSLSLCKYFSFQSSFLSSGKWVTGIPPPDVWEEGIKGTFLNSQGEPFQELWIYVVKKLIIPQNTRVFFLNLSDRPKGIYFIRIKD